jgi:hypothetical protein
MKRLKKAVLSLGVIAMLGGATYVVAEGIGIPCFNHVTCLNGSYIEVLNYCARSPSYCCLRFENTGYYDNGNANFNCFAISYCVHCRDRWKWCERHLTRVY